ncbi:hypothetical protein N8940_01945 [Sphingomonadaceae bacterium]|nr:hypothetical protein [Sphingomonadaceae bacterium]
MSEQPDDGDPHTESDPERIAHRDAYFEKCLDGSSAAPDELYCEWMADKTIAYYTDVGMTQEVLHYGTYGLVDRFYHTPTPLEEMEAKVEAERLAERSGPDGSTRFTGGQLAEYEAALDDLYAESDVFMSKAQRCDPEGEFMLAFQQQRPGVPVSELHKGMDCAGWDN